MQQSDVDSSRKRLDRPIFYFRFFAGIGPLLCAATLWPGEVFAGNADIFKADNALSLDFGASYLNYAETQSGMTLDTEKGWLPTAHIGVGMMASERSPIANLYLHIDSQMSLGTTAYNGALCDQFGNCTPYQSDTYNHFFDSAIQLGRGFPLGNEVIVTPFAEIGYRYWARHAGGIGAYAEDYWNWDGLGGLLAQYSPADRWVLSLEGGAGKTFGADMETSGKKFKLGSELIWRTKAEVGYRLTDHLELTSTAAYESIGFAASAVDTNGYYEPDSTTHQTTLMLGVAYHFF